MTVKGFLARGSTRIGFEIHRDGGGNLAIAVDIGKPDQKWHEVSTQTPKVRDDWSAVENIVVLGMFKGADAYSRANSLVEDLVKPHSDGEPLRLDLTQVKGWDQEVDVGVPSEDSVELDYQLGAKNRVDLRLKVPPVTETLG